MKISKEKLLNKTTSHEPEFIEALELLVDDINANKEINMFCLLYTSPSPRDRQKSRMPSSA